MRSFVLVELVNAHSVATVSGRGETSLQEEDEEELSERQIDVHFVHRAFVDED